VLVDEPEDSSIVLPAGRVVGVLPPRDAADRLPVIEAIPWALGKSPISRAFAWFLAAWAKRMG
jgi:hypothetical protein